MVPIWTTEIGVTNQRLIYKRGLLWRTTQELQLRAIEEVKLTQGLLGRLLDFGRLELHGTGVGDIILPSLADPVGLAQSAAGRHDRCRAAACSRRGAARGYGSSWHLPFRRIGRGAGTPSQSRPTSWHAAGSCFVSSCRALRADDRSNEARPHIASTWHVDCAAELQGEVLFDRFSRGRYSTDASHYQIEPLGVIVPKTDDDVRAAMAIAREEGVPLLPRGGGTSQSGQTVGRALVMDFSKHLNRLVSLDAGARTCVVEPGIVLDELNRQLRAVGLVVSCRCLHVEPRHHRRHGRQQLLRHPLDPLRHHARQRAGHRCDPGRRQRSAFRRGGA